jgi:hypothetical protein
VGEFKPPLYIYFWFSFAARAAATVRIDDQLLSQAVNPRHNFGAVFYAYSPITVVTELYPHHVVFSLPTRKIYVQVAETRSYFSHLMQREIKSSEDTLFQLMHDIFRNHADHILNFINNVEILFPEIRLSNRARISRSMCNLCAEWYWVVYGVAAQNELADLAFWSAKIPSYRGDVWTTLETNSRHLRHSRRLLPRNYKPFPIS